MNAHRLSETQATLLQQWWQGLQPRDPDDERNIGRCGPFLSLGRGDRAALQRCSSLEQLMCEPAFVHLRFHWTQGDEAAPWAPDAQACALVAGLVARVRHRGTAQATRPLAALLGQGRGGGETPVMSRMRFEQLLRSGDEDELFLRMRRALDMLDSQPIEIGELADDLLAWTAELQGDVPPPAERIRVIWARRYFSEALRKPAAGRAKSKPPAAATA